MKAVVRGERGDRKTVVGCARKIIVEIKGQWMARKCKAAQRSVAKV